MMHLLTLMVLASGLFAQAPTIVSTYPPQNALNVLLDSPVSVTFGVDINPCHHQRQYLCRTWWLHGQAERDV